MDGGKIEAQGNFNTLSEMSEKFSSLMKDHGIFDEKDGETSEDGKNKLKMSIGNSNDKKPEEKKEEVWSNINVN